MAVTDILVTTCNRLEYLIKTLDFIRERTRSAYRLTVVDDGSGEGNAGYLYDEWSAGRIDNILLRAGRVGAMANLNAGAWVTFSDPVVITDDDVLCPDVEPDWLARGLDAMALYPDVGMLALHHPGAKLKGYKVCGPITLCESLGATFLFVRRAILENHPLRHALGDLSRPMEARCRRVRDFGWKIGYLTGTYCYHTGKQSALTGRDYQGHFIMPEDWHTLVPPERWRR